MNAVGQDGTSLAFTVSDQDGYLINQDRSSGSWHPRHISLNGLAGKALAHVYVTGDQSNTGDWSADFADIGIISASGSVLPLYNGQSMSLSYCCSSGMSNYQQSTVSAPEPGMPGNMNYYLSDHLGTTQMELSAGGWPVWEEQFAPFGKNWITVPRLCATHLLAKNKIQNQELDYFGARYYASSMGRWVSSDPVVFSRSLGNPQSWNKHS